MPTIIGRIPPGSTTDGWYAEVKKVDENGNALSEADQIQRVEESSD